MLHYKNAYVLTNKVLVTRKLLFYIHICGVVCGEISGEIMCVDREMIILINQTTNDLGQNSIF